MRHTRTVQWLTLAIVVLCATWSGADDRDFLRTRAAPPNLMFILDTSGSNTTSYLHDSWRGIN